MEITTTQKVPFSLIPVDANGGVSKIFPGSAGVVCDDPTLGSITKLGELDFGFIASGKVGAAKLNATANADVSGASTQTITGTADISVVAPPAGVATGLNVVFGTPVAQ